MKYLITFLFVCLFVSQELISAQSYTKEERVYWLSKIWKDVSDNFYDTQKLKAMNWDSIYISYLPQVESVEKKCDYYGILSDFIGLLHDEHSGFYNRGGCTEEESSYDSLPFEIATADGRFYVSRVLQELVDSIPLGSELLTVENQPVLEYLNKNFIPVMNGNTPQVRLRKALSQFRIGIADKSISIRIKTPQENILGKAVQYNSSQFVNRSRLRILQNQRRENRLSLNQDINHTPYYYFRFDGFDLDEISTGINQLVDSIQLADYLVLDLRRNSGGSEAIADSLLMCFLDMDTLKTYPSITRVNQAYYAAKGYGYSEYKDYYEETAVDTLPEEIVVKKNLPYFNQLLFVLISDETCSAAEDLLITLKLHYPDRAILVGTPTSGSTGAPLVRLLNSDVYYRICTRGPLLPKGLFENGIQPDYSYSSGWEEMVSGEDHIFEFIADIFDKNLKIKK
ncbi:hypothetical protein FACS189440_11520 [Bacteroidia bacterium]|nr:hypothetical protein FACS189440_11520 [Bacteroidia bacterium]